MTQISVVIPTYNRPEQLKACLNSLRDQRIASESFEVVIVDDGGNTDTRQVATPFQQHFQLRVIRQENSGPGGARNTGVAAAQGEFIAFTDDDCLPDENWLVEILASLQRDPTLLIGGKTINHIEGNIYSEASQALIDYSHGYQTHNNSKLRMFPSNNMALARKGFVSAGGFDKKFKLVSGEDREFCDRWLHNGNVLEFIPKAVIQHCHQLNLTGFCELHYRYGKGARQFWQTRTSRGQGTLSEEKLGFYIGLLFYPWKNKLPRPFFSSCLLALSQVVNAAGYFSESRRDRKKLPG